MLYTLVFLAAIILAFGLLVLGNTLERLLIENFSMWGMLAKFILAFRTLISIVVFVAAFTAGYKYLAGTGCTFRDAIPGVVITTASWIVFSSVYGIYITHISRYITLYGSLGALIFLFLWLYFCILILMIGAEFNVFYADWRARRARRLAREEDSYLAGGEEMTEQLIRDYIRDTAAREEAEADFEESSLFSSEDVE